MSSMGFWLGLAVSVSILVSTLVGLVRWAHRQIVKSVRLEMETPQRELTRNGGSSLIDAIERIEREVNRQGLELDRVCLAFERHLGFHEGSSV